MSRRSSPAFAIGGVSWLDQSDECHDIVVPPEGFWRCFICDDRFYSVRAALRHFGVEPKKPPRCLATPPSPSPDMDKDMIDG